MRRNRPATTVAVDAPAPHTIYLEIEQRPGPLRGRVTAGEHDEREFEGWLGLLALLASLLDEPGSIDGRGLSAGIRSVVSRSDGAQ